MAKMQGDFRVGFGFDVHEFEVGRKLILGGVVIPHTSGLKGHSDADAVIHAVIDALLGAASLGDIGQHFPDTDSAYKGADSRKLLRDVHDKIVDGGWRISNVDVSVVAQAPRISPHATAMTQNIASDLKLSPNQINIKATTTESLGFVGREEGVAVWAVASLVG